nr:immunoglobulin heavy chain junction region [Macaca mulatta]MOW87126.1 immunoglobulin heavy chain junction region [Macaca mulatta]MOW87389.1 immunoglobulin heavy chain junction region [Macaca mulatta]MOW87999.1 immunoglobulin heavy chain junction region [Macaca mulatta]MOW88040.1 immunoglobulin heavy chain junction region [Macaca mulatta]
CARYWAYSGSDYYFDYW